MNSRNIHIRQYSKSIINISLVDSGICPVSHQITPSLLPFPSSLPFSPSLLPFPSSLPSFTRFTVQPRVSSPARLGLADSDKLDGCFVLGTPTICDGALPELWPQAGPCLTGVCMVGVFEMTCGGDPGRGAGTWLWIGACMCGNGQRSGPVHPHGRRQAVPWDAPAAGCGRHGPVRRDVVPASGGRRRCKRGKVPGCPPVGRGRQRRYGTPPRTA